MNGEIAGKAIGAFQIVRYYTEPSTTPTGEAEGLKVYKTRYEILRYSS